MELKIIGAIAGGLLGLLYYKKVGCSTGTCLITSNRYSSVIYGAFLGFFVTSLF